MEEIWKNIQGYEGKYQVSNFGRIKNSKGLILKLHKDNSGYPMVSLFKNAKHIRVRIHRLVAEAFISNPNNYPCVNHKDEDKTNNNVDNLEWCSNKYNSNYGTCQQRRIKNTDYKKKVENTDWKKKVDNTDYKAISAKIDYKEVGRKLKEKMTNRKDLSKTVLQFTKEGKFIMEWLSTMECGRNGFNQGAVASCCRGELKSHKGFIWKYKE